MIDRSPRTPELQRSPPRGISRKRNRRSAAQPARAGRVGLIAGRSADHLNVGRSADRRRWLGAPLAHEEFGEKRLTRVAANARAPAFAPNPNTRNRRRRPTAAQATPAGRSVCGWLCRPTSLRSARPARPSHTREFGARKPNAVKRARPAPRRPHDRSFAANARAPAFAPKGNIAKTKSAKRRPAGSSGSGRSDRGSLC
jgi:hypothetical protein